MRRRNMAHTKREMGSDAGIGGLRMNGKLTIYDWFGYDIPITERYRLIKQAGFDGVLLWWSNTLDRGDYRRGPQIARDAGLFVENIHTPFQVQDNIWLDNLQGEAAVECYLQCISDCAEFNIPTMVLHLPDDDKPYNGLGLDRMKRLADTAEKRNVNVALENLNNCGNLSFMLQQVDSDRIGFCYDCCHHYNYCPEKDLLAAYGSRMMALHLHDTESGNIHQIPLDGTLDWPGIMKQITATGYIGATAIEAMNWNYPHLTAHEYLHRAYDSAVRLEELRRK